MSSRYWAPTRPTLEPDAVVLALMGTGTDPTKDLMGALLAIHRAGAGACEAVAKGAVPGESGLIDALATCRARIAPPAAECISKCVVDRKYAHLLTRDIFDDAEQAALNLFRACVSKGVAPPIAAQRVGYVFGVPSKGLGRFFALATDPKANPVSVLDAGDRVLLAHMQKVATEETEVEEVAKAVTFTEQDHPRNAGGRFVDVLERPETDQATVDPVDTRTPDSLTRLRRMLGIEGSAPAVADAPAVIEAKPKTGSLKPLRPLRKLRQIKPKPKEVTQPGVVPSTTAPKVKSRLDVKLDAKLQAKLVTEFKAAVAAQPPEKRVVKPRGDWRGLGKRTESYGDEGYGDIPDAVTFSMPSWVGQSLTAYIAKNNQAPGFAKVFRIKDLLGFAGEPEEAMSGPADYARESNANNAWSGVQEMFDQDPDIVQIPAGAPQAWIDETKKTMLADFTTSSGKFVGAEAVGRLVFQATDYDDPTQQILVRLHPSRDFIDDYREPMVHEWVIKQGAVGRVEGVTDSSEQQKSYVMDPNQVYQLTHANIFFDTKHNVRVYRENLVPVEEPEALEIEKHHKAYHFRDVNKAATAVLERPFVEADVLRDYLGRFADQDQEQKSAPAPVQPKVPAKLKPLRPLRALRPIARPKMDTTVSVARPEAKMQTQLQTGLHTRLQAGLASAMKTRLSAPTVTRKKLGVLDDTRQYHVMSLEEFYTVVGGSDRDFGKPVILNSPSRHFLYSRSVVGAPFLADTGSMAADLMRLNVQDAVAIGPSYQTLFPIEIEDNAEGYEKMDKAIDAAFEADPKLSILDIRLIGTTTAGESERGRSHRPIRLRYEISGARPELATQVLIEQDDNLDLRGHIELIPIGHYQSKDMMIRGNGDAYPLQVGFNADEVNPFNAPVQIFRLHNIDVQRYRATQWDNSQ